MAIELDMQKVASDCEQQFTVVSRNGNHVCYFGLLRLGKDGPFIPMHLGDSKPNCTMVPRSECDLSRGDADYAKVISAAKEVCNAANAGFTVQAAPTSMPRKQEVSKIVTSAKPIIRKRLETPKEKIPIAYMGFNPGKYTCPDCATPIPDGGVCPNCY